jgi:hypothetical protein
MKVVKLSAAAVFSMTKIDSITGSYNNAYKSSLKSKTIQRSKEFKICDCFSVDDAI